MNLSVFSFLGNCCVHQMCVFFLARRSSCWCAVAVRHHRLQSTAATSRLHTGCTQCTKEASDYFRLPLKAISSIFSKSFRYLVVLLYIKTASHFQNIRSRLYYSRMLMVASKKDVRVSEWTFWADCPPSETLCTKKISTFARCVCTLWCGGARALSFSPGFQSPNMRLFVHSARSQG